MRNYRLWFVRILAALSGVAFLVLTPVAPAAPPVQSAHPGAEPASTGYALRFYGNGTGDIDRVKVRIDPPYPCRCRRRFHHRVLDEDDRKRRNLRAGRIRRRLDHRAHDHRP
jgi:hypothetical protein